MLVLDEGAYTTFTPSTTAPQLRSEGIIYPASYHLAWVPLAVQSPTLILPLHGQSPWQGKLQSICAELQR